MYGLCKSVLWPQELPILSYCGLWSHMNVDMVSYISNIPQNDVGSYVGLCSTEDHVEFT